MRNIGLFIILESIYCYFLLRRITTLIPKFKKLNKRTLNIVVFTMSFIIVLFFSERFTTKSVILMHFLAVALLIELINLIVNKIKPTKIWAFLYRSSILTLTITIVYLTYGYLNIKNIHNTEYLIESTKLEESLKIAFISDLHMERTMDIKELNKHCTNIVKENPDLVLLGGDIIDEGTSLEGLRAVAKCFGEIPSKYGSYFIYGNHDNFGERSIWRSILTRENIQEVFAEHNINILEDKIISVDNKITIIGRADASFRQDALRATLKELMKDVDTKEYTILVDHQPIELNGANDLGVDLMLSGHTHGSQLWPGTIVNNITNQYELNYGLKKIGNLNAIVSSGMGGFGGIFRTGSISEVVYITIN